MADNSCDFLPVKLLEVSASLYRSSVHHRQRMWTIFIDRSQQENPPDVKHCSGVQAFFHFVCKAVVFYAYKWSSFLLQHYKQALYVLCWLCYCIAVPNYTQTVTVVRTEAGHALYICRQRFVVIPSFISFNDHHLQYINIQSCIKKSSSHL